MAFSPGGRTVYASQIETASVWEIDRATFRVRRQLATKGNWSKVMALSPDERTLYVANWVSSDISEIDLAKGKVRRLLKTVRTPRGLWPTTDGRRLYADDMGTDEAFVVDLASERVRNGASYYYAVPAYQALAAGGGGRAAAHRAELAKR